MSQTDNQFARTTHQRTKKMTRRARIHPAASPLRVRIHFAATLFRVRTHLAVPLLLAIAIFSCAADLCADNTDQAGWQRQEVNWRVSGGSRVKAIHHPADQMPPTRLARATPQARPTSQPVSAEQAAGHSALAVQDQGAPIIATVVDSPPVDAVHPSRTRIGRVQRPFADRDQWEGGARRRVEIGEFRLTQ